MTFNFSNCVLNDMSMQFTRKKMKTQRRLTFFDSKEIHWIEKKEMKRENEHRKDKCYERMFIIEIEKIVYSISLISFHGR